MQNWYTEVREFHRACDLPVAPRPALPDPAARQLRMRLLLEEVTELTEAEISEDLTQIADALADIIYIACGTALAYGIPLDEVFTEVHRSNLTKVGPDGTVVVRADGKILKGAQYDPPHIARILHGWDSGR